MAVIPILNSVFIAFSPDRYGRWLFMFSLLLSLATAVVCEKADKYRDSLKYGLIISMGVILTFTIALCCLKRIHYDGIEIFRIHRFVLNIMSAVLGVVVLAAIIKNKRSECTKIYKGATIFFSVCLLGVSVFDYQNGALDNTGINFRIESNQYSKNVSTYLTEIPSLLKRNVLPYRYYFDEGIGYTYYNLSMTNELPSTNSFISTCHSSVFDFYRALGINRGNMSPAGPVGMQELLGARYIVTMKKLSNLKLIKHIKNANNQDFYIYANQAALPMGTLYDSYITKSEFNKVSAELRALVMLHTLVIEDQDVEKVEKQLKHAPEYIELAGEELLKRTIQNKNPNSNFETKKNTLNIRLEADKKEFAFYSIPYDRFWKVKVNGYDAEMYNCNGLIAIPVEKGENIIEFRYEYTPFKVGIPCYNEEKVLPITAPLFKQEIMKLINRNIISVKSKIMFVNDGSKDQTWNILCELAKKDDCFLGISQSRNRGHQNAVLAGLMESKDQCDITISIDCDGQDDINAMDSMVEEYLKGNEIVYGVRSRRDTDTFFKRFTAESFYKLLNWMGTIV